MAAAPNPRGRNVRAIRNRNGRFCWCRKALPVGGSLWRLFRRSETTGAWHGAMVSVYSLNRGQAARRLVAARRELLERVDTLDLQRLGVLP